MGILNPIPAENPGQGDAAPYVAAPSPGGSSLTIQEVDGSPAGVCTTLVLPNGTLAIVAGVATYTPAGGSSARNTITTVPLVGSNYAIDYSLGDYFQYTIAATPATMTFTNLPAAGTGITLVIRIQQDAATPAAQTWPASFKWAQGIASSISNVLSSVNELVITSFDQGTTWFAQLNRDIA